MDNIIRNRVLIIDDEKQNLKILNNILSPEYVILTANSGCAALKMMEDNIPDIILLDIVMPDMSGFDVLTTLKSNEKTKKIPVVIITGLTDDENEEKALALEAVDFIHKPFNSGIVKARIRQQIQIVNHIRAFEQYTQTQSDKSAMEEKSKFFARMSHEMRTPLNAVIGLAGLTLEADELNEATRENVENICNAGESLLGIVNDILDFSKMESGKFKLVPAEYDFPGMISSVITQSIMWKDEKPIELVLNIDENIPYSLTGDELRIKQILNNLLSNAFKYTKSGTVELNVKSEKKEAEDILLVMSVKDSGIGIKKEFIEFLFNEYAQADVMSNKNIVGTGLGLPITKTIADMMGGTIEVESEYGKGSVFTVRLPQKYKPGADGVCNVLGPKTVKELNNFQYHGKKRKKLLSRVCLPYARVLVVDDVATNLDVAKGMMKPYNMQIDCVTSGQQAIDAIRKEKVRYNAIFMDHMMPEMDGIEATRIIREEIGTEYAKKIPIIVFTANAIAGNEEMFLSKGFQAFVSKPVDIMSLDAVLMRWVRDEELEKNSAGRQINVNGEMIPDKRSGKDRRSGKKERRTGYDRRNAAKKIKSVKFNKGLERFSGDWETYVQVLQSFSFNTPAVLETIREVNRETLSAYAITVHGMKSSCRSICAEEAGNQAEALEHSAKAGDLNFVTANNPAFIETVSGLINEINSVFVRKNGKKEKPKKDKPYREALLELKSACEDYNPAKVNEIIAQIDAFEYTAQSEFAGNDLVQWIKENAAQKNFLEIAQRLADI
ncbi:MAG: response regulator [Treponema sp.]|jgi:signal transduction histidine kinase|nr:response regulator [Treponema sp.]